MKDEYLETFFQSYVEWGTLYSHIEETYGHLLTQQGLNELYGAASQDLEAFEATRVPLPTFYATLKKLGLYDDED